LALSRKNSKANPSAGTADDAEARAAARHDSIVRATAGAETVPAVVDSSGNAIEDVTPLSAEERSAARDALR